ncbi:MAG: hypothetical protein AB8H12_24565 [Lewinella sp.]
MPIKTGRDPAQYGLFATPLEAMIAPDAEVRVIAAFVDQLNLGELDFQPINNMGVYAFPINLPLNNRISCFLSFSRKPAPLHH